MVKLNMAKGGRNVALVWLAGLAGILILVGKKVWAAPQLVIGQLKLESSDSGSIFTTVVLGSVIQNNGGASGDYYVDLTVDEMPEFQARDLINIPADGSYEWSTTLMILPGARVTFRLTGDWTGSNTTSLVVQG